MTLNTIQCHRNLRNARRDQPFLQTFHGPPKLWAKADQAPLVTHLRRSLLPAPSKALWSKFAGRLVGQDRRACHLFCSPIRGNSCHSGQTLPPKKPAIPHIPPNSISRISPQALCSLCVLPCMPGFEAGHILAFPIPFRLARDKTRVCAHLCAFVRLSRDKIGSRGLCFQSALHDPQSAMSL